MSCRQKQSWYYHVPWVAKLSQRCKSDNNFTTTVISIKFFAYPNSYMSWEYRSKIKKEKHAVDAMWSCNQWWLSHCFKKYWLIALQLPLKVPVFFFMVTFLLHSLIQKRIFTTTDTVFCLRFMKYVSLWHEQIRNNLSLNSASINRLAGHSG